MVWPFGKENWCNLQGRYLHIVADMAEVVQDAPGTDEISVCTLGVFGTKYLRESAFTVPSSFEVHRGQTGTLLIKNIISQFSIGNELNINLRQTSQLPFVTFTELEDATEVTIDAANVGIGSYTLKFESFDANGSVQSTLMSDQIKIIILKALQDQEPEPEEPESEVAEPKPPSFAEPLEHQLIKANKLASWPLPEIIAGDADFKELSIEPGAYIEEFSYNASENRIYFAGSNNVKPRETTTADDTVFIKIKLSDALGREQLYLQIVQLEFAKPGESELVSGTGEQNELSIETNTDVEDA